MRIRGHVCALDIEWSPCHRSNAALETILHVLGSSKPPWPNGQGVGLLIRRLWARVPQGVTFISPSHVISAKTLQPRLSMRCHARSIRRVHAKAWCSLKLCGACLLASIIWRWWNAADRLKDARRCILTTFHNDCLRLAATEGWF